MRDAAASAYGSGKTACKAISWSALIAARALAMLAMRLLRWMVDWLACSAKENNTLPYF
jgi:hypothetical protein